MARQADGGEAVVVSRVPADLLILPLLVQPDVRRQHLVPLVLNTSQESIRHHTL